MGFMDSLSGLFSGASLARITNYGIWGLVIGSLIAVVVIVIRDKVKYKYCGEILKRRQTINSELPEAVNVEGKAGYFVSRKSGRNVFRIKYGIMPWQVVELSKLPDPKYMVGNKAYYIQLNKDNLIQAKLSIDWEGNLKLSPVEDDLKSMAMLDIKDKEKVLSTSKMTPMVVGMMVMGFILVTGIIVYYFITKGG